MSEAPSDRPILVWDANTEQYRVCQRMTAFEDGAVDWVYARGFNGDGAAIAFIVRDAGGWIELPSERLKAAVSSVTRFEVIDETGRAYVRDHRIAPISVSLSYQDDGRTLKIFVEPRN